MQISKTMLEKYLYGEVEGIFRKKVESYSFSSAKEDIDTVYNNLKNVTVEINEDVVEAQVLDYLNNSVLWVEDNRNAGIWAKTDLSDILAYIENNRKFANNTILESLVDIINIIGNSKCGE